MHYGALASSSELHKAMLVFTRVFAAAEGEHFTNHLSFDLMIGDSQVDEAHILRETEKPIFYPIERNPRAHTAIVLLDGTSDFADGYMDVMSTARDDK